MLEPSQHESAGALLDLIPPPPPPPPPSSSSSHHRHHQQQQQQQEQRRRQQQQEEQGQREQPQVVLVSSSSPPPTAAPPTAAPPGGAPSPGPFTTRVFPGLSYDELTAMVARGETPPNVRTDIDDSPPDPTRALPTPLAPRELPHKPWHATSSNPTLNPNPDAFPGSEGQKMTVMGASEYRGWREGGIGAPATMATPGAAFRYSGGSTSTSTSASASASASARADKTKTNMTGGGGVGITPGVTLASHRHPHPGTGTGTGTGTEMYDRNPSYPYPYREEEGGTVPWVLPGGRTPTSLAMGGANAGSSTSTRATSERGPHGKPYLYPYNNPT